MADRERIAMSVPPRRDFAARLALARGAIIPIGCARLTVAGLGLRTRVLQNRPSLRATENDRVRSASDLIGAGSAKL